MSKLVSYNGKTFWVTEQQAESLAVLEQTRKGGCAKINGYRPSTNVIEQPIYDLQVITRFNLGNLYKRKNEALANIRFTDVEKSLDNEPKLKVLDRDEKIRLFNERKNELIESMNKTLDGDRSDAHRQGHDRCYASVSDGVKVHYKTEKGADGTKDPILVDGFPVADSIMLSVLELNRHTVLKGSYKTVNSGAPKLMTNAIEKVLNARSVGLKMLSLKGDNFDSLRIDGAEFIREDFRQLAGDVLED